MSTFDLRAAYINGGFSRRAFARASGVPEQSLRRLEKGHGVTPANAKKVVDCLKAELDIDLRVTDLMPVGVAA